MLYSGVYLMYVSEAEKEKLRTFAGLAVQVDAESVRQPVNPGDGLIQRLSYRGPAPPGPDGKTLAGLRLTTAAAFPQPTPGGVVPEGRAESAPGSHGEQRRLFAQAAALQRAGKIRDLRDLLEHAARELQQRATEFALPALSITLTNLGETSLTLRSSELAPTLLTRKLSRDRTFSPADGPSIALITRSDFWVWDRAREWDVRYSGDELFGWSLAAGEALPERVTLAPRERRKIVLHFSLPPGEYDFLAGYGGGVHATACVASNLTAFNVTETGEAMVVDRPSKQPRAAGPALAKRC